MLTRKILREIERFYQDRPARAMMITGARQVGKSYIIEEYGRAHFPSFIKIDFIEHPEYVQALEGAKSSEEILLRLSATFGHQMIPGQTMIFFDEVQECKELITQIKYLVQDRRFTYILSGSLLGTVMKEIASIPVGYVKPVRMYPLDFEEFMLANGVGEQVIDHLRDCFHSEKAVDAYIHTRMMSLFDLYLIVGGMPAAVNTYLETRNLRRVSDEQFAIIELYRQDIAKYDPDEKLYLREIFNLIPSELNAKNKRFIMKNMNANATFAKYTNSFLWLKNAGVALPSYVADEPKSPLILSRSSNLFKLFLNDVGLLAAMYGGDIQLQILNHQTAINFGAIYENAAGQELLAHGYELYFYNSKKFGEIDFLLEENEKIIPLEIKSGKDYHRHRAINNLVSNPEYGISKGYVFCQGNTEKIDLITYFPIYLLMFLQKPVIPEEIIFPSDFNDLNVYLAR